MEFRGLIGFIALALQVTTLSAQPSKAEAKIPEEVAGLRLEVEAFVRDFWTSDGKTWTRGQARLWVTVAVKNVGEKPVTVPSRPYFPERQRKASWSSREYFPIFIRLPEFRNEKVAISEAAFAPVTLQPGEVAVLERIVLWTEEIDEAKRLQFAEIRFHVSPKLATDRGWWSGTISRVVEIEKNFEEKPPDA